MFNSRRIFAQSLVLPYGDGSMLMILVKNSLEGFSKNSGKFL